MPTRRTKIIFFTSLFLVIIAIVCFILMYVSMNSLIENSVIKENQIITETQSVDSISIMKKDLEANSTQIAELSDFIIGSENTIDFVKTLETISAQNDLKINVKNVIVSDLPANKLELLKFNVDVTGEWKNVEYFLEILENYPLKITINGFSLTKFTDNLTKGKTTPQWVGSFDFSVVKMK